MTQFIGKYILRGEIEAVTGLHIGGSTTGIEIGGLDNPVIKDPLSDEPYIPGSSLKGKLRTLTEWSFGLIAKHGRHGDSYAAYACEEVKDIKDNTGIQDPKVEKALRVARLFGANTNTAEVRAKAGPTRLTVRDAFLSIESKDELNQLMGVNIFTEVKTENALDRVTAEANPRPLERVPRGTRFNLEMLLDVYDLGSSQLMDDCQLFATLFSSMRLLEQSSLGGGGSRGHGQIKFSKLTVAWRPLTYYLQGELEQSVSLPGKTPAELVERFKQISWPA
jgi:CRISPR-associated protein Csm3